MSKSLQQTIEESRKLLEISKLYERVDNQGESGTVVMTSYSGPYDYWGSKIRTGNSNVTPPKKKRKKRKKTNYLNKK